MIIHQEVNFALEWNEKDQIISYTHIGYSEGDHFRANALKMVDLLAEKKGHKLLLNTLEMKVLNQKDQEWLNEVFVPLLVEAGLRYQATVIPKSALGEISLKKVINRIADKNLEVAYFSDAAAAEVWLRSK
jgi:hypothetical protein